ncbi:MAG TPA: hypothetical protein PKX87_03485 [Alphaproteobacteria bacterium]|nr:hypothetical protein [Alphaproteobacteria bacterium]
MKRTAIFAIGPALAALISLGAPQTAKAQEAYCREYTRTVWIGGQARESYGTACLKPDGAWETVSERPQNLPFESRFEARYEPDFSDPVVLREPVPLRRTVVVHHAQPIVVYRNAPPYAWGRRFGAECVGHRHGHRDGGYREWCHNGYRHDRHRDRD